MARQADVKNKKATFRNCAPFSNCISEINNTSEDNASYSDVAIKYMI